VGGRASGAAAHLEALSDSDGEGERRGGKSLSPRGGGGPASRASSAGADKGLQGRAALGDGNSPAVASSAPWQEREGAAVHASQRRPASGDGGGGPDAAVARGADESAKEKDKVEQVLPSSEELLGKIQVVDDAIAATDAAIANLQADALQGEGAIFGMSAKRNASVLIFGSCAMCLPAACPLCLLCHALLTLTPHFCPPRGGCRREALRVAIRRAAC
jgi:hypothetical protein